MLRRTASVLLHILLPVLMLAACGGGRSANLDWGECPDYLEADAYLQCACMSVPLNHADATSPAIEVLLMRSLGGSRQKKGQIWFLAGGPGESIDLFSYPFLKWAQTHPEYDYYAMEHRGTGASTPLLCSTEAPSGACLRELLDQWGAGGLAAFNPTQAAHDLAMAMQKTATAARRYLYGFSYGTYLAQRFFHLYDRMIDAAVLDGVVPAAPGEDGLLPLDAYDTNFDATAEDIADLCDHDPVCSARIREYAPNTGTLIAGTYEAIRSGTVCAGLRETLTTTALRNASAIVSDYRGRLIFPAIYYRISRCSASDVEAIDNLLEPAQSSAAETDPMHPRFSEILNFNIVAGELLGAKTLDRVEAETQTCIASPDETVQDYRYKEELAWPLYEKDACTHRWPSTQVPLLVMNGDLDPQTPMSNADAVMSHYSGANQHLVAFPTVRHGTLFYSLLEGIARRCGYLRHAHLFRFHRPPGTGARHLLPRKHGQTRLFRIVGRCPHGRTRQFRNRERVGLVLKRSNSDFDFPGRPGYGKPRRHAPRRGHPT